MRVSRSRPRGSGGAFERLRQRGGEGRDGVGKRVLGEPCNARDKCERGRDEQDVSDGRGFGVVDGSKCG